MIALRSASREASADCVAFAMCVLGQLTTSDLEVERPLSFIPCTASGPTASGPFAADRLCAAYRSLSSR